MTEKLNGNVKMTLDIDMKKLTYQQELALRIFLLLNQKDKQSQAFILLKKLELTFIQPMEATK
jgi:hypothetical protein